MHIRARTTAPALGLVALLVAGVLLAASALFSGATRRFGMPVGLVFVAIGMLAGREGLGIAFEDYAFAWRLGTVALALILFDGGLSTPAASVRRVMSQASSQGSERSSTSSRISSATPMAGCVSFRCIATLSARLVSRPCSAWA